MFILIGICLWRCPRQPMTEDHPFIKISMEPPKYVVRRCCVHSIIYGLDYVGLRYMNVYGPRQDYQGAYIAVIMKMLDAIDRGEVQQSW